MSDNQTIFVGVFEGFSWIRSEGKGSFMNSPFLKQFGEARIADGETCVVVDLGGCTGMDSTFMGTLAGIAKSSASTGGVLQIADPGDRNRRSLEDLGLDYLMQIDPPGAVWNDSLDDIRDALQNPPASGDIGELVRIKLSLEAHRALADLSEENEEKFRDVVDMMAKDVKEKVLEDIES